MKIRTGFVSNSSSTSYCLIGTENSAVAEAVSNALHLTDDDYSEGTSLGGQFLLIDGVEYPVCIVWGGRSDEEKGPVGVWFETLNTIGKYSTLKFRYAVAKAINKLLDNKAIGRNHRNYCPIRAKDIDIHYGYSCSG
jgi:hypothetical protein